MLVLTEASMNKEESLAFLQSRIEKVKNATEQDVQFYKEVYDRRDSLSNTKRWKRPLDIFPSEWVGTNHEKELDKELEIGDYAKVVVDSQCMDFYTDGEKVPRAIGKIGKVVKIDTIYEWSYFIVFETETGRYTNWFKRYALEKVN